MMMTAGDSKFVSDFKSKECPAFVSFAGKQARGPKVLVFNDADIPLTKDAFGARKQVGVNFVVVDCLAEGFSKVPYMQINKQYKVDPKTAKPLSEKSAWSEDGDFSMLKCWPYGIIEGYPKEKQQRNEDYKWEIHPGMVLRIMFWADAAKGGDPKKFKDGLFPDCAGSEIKAFTLMELELACKGWSKWEVGDKREDGKECDICPVKKGYGMGLNAIGLIPNATLYSVLDKLPRMLPQTMEKCRAKQVNWQEKFAAIKELIQINQIPFFIKAVNPDVSIDVDTRLGTDDGEMQICLSNWAPSAGYDSTSTVDILVEHAMRATNAGSIESACCLLEVAAAAGALSLVVVYNQYRPGKEHVKSAFSGYPLIDTKVLLKGLANMEQLQEDPEKEGFYMFQSGFTLPDEEENDFEPLLLVSKEPVSHTEKKKEMPSQDFFLVADDSIKLQKGYQLMLMHPELRDKFVAWQGYANMGKPQMHMAGAAAAVAGGGKPLVPGKRGKWAQMTASTFLSRNASGLDEESEEENVDEDEEEEEEPAKKSTKKTNKKSRK